MAGTLTVQNIQGPSSGANANKIIIPAGQTLDASAAELAPSAGGLVQVVNSDPTVAWPSRTATSSTSYIKTDYSLTITPKYANSKIILTADFSYGIPVNFYGYINVYRNISGGSSTALGDGASGVKAFGSRVYWGNVSFEYVDTPNTTSPITYEIWLKTNDGTGTCYLGWAGNGGYTGHNQVFMCAKEIKQ